MNVFDALLALLCFLLAGTLVGGAWRAARISRLPVQPVQIALITLAAWLAFTAALAHSGVLDDWTARPPRVVLLPLAVFVALIAASRTSYVAQLISATPASVPLFLQSFRVAVEIGLYGLYIQGRAPHQVTFEGSNFDIIAGLSAPLVALVVSRAKLIGWTRTFVVAWNILGLVLLVNIVYVAATSVPGPLYLHWPGGPFQTITTWPIVWIPAFLAPAAVFLHIVSFRQVLGSPRTTQPVADAS